MVKICWDLCERDMTKDENRTKVILEDENGYDSLGFCGVVRKPRKLRIDICDNCLKLLKSKAREL